MNPDKFSPSHVRKFVRARSRWARFTLEERVGFMVRRWPLYGSAAHELSSLMRRLEIDVVVDIGAHHGGFGRLTRRLGHQGPIVSFEPAQAAFGALARARHQDPTWTAHRLALGPAPGQLDLDVYEQTQLNSLRRPVEGGSPMGFHPIRTETVEVVALDDVWDELVPPGRSLLKIDAQGYDLEVMRGAEQSLARSVALVTEVSGLALYEGSPPLHEVVTYLYERSFRLTGLFPIVRDPADRLQVIDFDATFVRVPIDRSDQPA